MSRLVLEGARLFDGEAAPIDGATVVVDGDRIAYAGPASAAPPTDLANRLVDVSGMAVMPGMVTCHFHAAYHDVTGPPMPIGFDRPPAYQAILAAQHLETALACGYTGAVSAGGPHDIDPALAMALADRAIRGPRFVPGSRDISSTGHGNDGVPWWWAANSEVAVRLCDGPIETAKAVRDEIKRGARMIKLFITTGHGVGAPHQGLDMTPAEVAAAVDTAHDRGVRVRAHVVNRRGIEVALDAGIDAIDHGDGLNQELIARMAESGTWLVPSMLLGRDLVRAMGPVPGFNDFETSRAILRDATAAGVRIVVGDDYGTAFLPHGTYSRELSCYVNDVGIPVADVLRWATRNGAQFLDQDEELGLLRGGAPADLIVVDGDPFDDITVLEDAANVVAVVQAGVLVKDRLVAASDEALVS